MYIQNIELCIFFVHLNTKDNVFCPYEFGHFFVRSVFFLYVRLQLLYLEVFRFPEILDLSDWFQQYECLV